MLLTVFTPTYNRAYTLPRLYESLVGQTCRDFEWLIVDDGSSDDTRSLVEGWIAEGKISIRYVYKENGGKPSAHNRGVAESFGELFFCVDSDDYLTCNAVEVIKGAWQSADEGNVGMLLYRAYPNGNKITDISNENVTNFTLKQGYDCYGLIGDTALVFRRDVISRFEFPTFAGEKFIPEGYVYDSIDKIGTLIVVREPIYICEYLEDGYTANMKRVLYNNPEGYFAYINNRLKIDCGVKARFLDSVRYMAMAIAKGKKRKIRDAVYPTLALMAYLPGWLLYRRDFKRYEK